MLHCSLPACLPPWTARACTLYSTGEHKGGSGGSHAQTSNSRKILDRPLSALAYVLSSPVFRSLFPARPVGKLSVHVFSAWTDGVMEEKTVLRGATDKGSSQHVGCKCAVRV